MKLYTACIAASAMVLSSASDLEYKVEESTQYELDNVRASHIVDGDTFYLSVRLIGIDSPERNEDLYREASDYLRELLRGRRVRIEQDEEQLDRYGRILGYVYVERDGEELFVNEEMVRRGYAEAKDYPPNTEYSVILDAAEQEAKDNNRGMWSD